MKKVFLIFFVIINFALIAQEDMLLKVNYSMSMPITQRDYLKDMSFFGVGIGVGKIFETNVSLALEINWNSFYQFEDRKTYYIKGGAITTDLFKYRQQIPVVLSLNYTFLREFALKPYTGLGIGFNYIDEKIMFSTYKIQDRTYGFLIQPKIGVAFGLGESGDYNIFIESTLNYSSNNANQFKYNSYSSLNFAIGGFVKL